MPRLAENDGHTGFEEGPPGSCHELVVGRKWGSFGVPGDLTALVRTGMPLLALCDVLPDGNEIIVVHDKQSHAPRTVVVLVNGGWITLT